MNTQETLLWINEQFSHTNELVQKTLEYEQKNIAYMYIKSLIDNEMLQKTIIKPFFEMANMEQFKLYVQALPQFEEVPAKEQVLLEIINGSILLEIGNELCLIDLKLSKNNEVSSASVEMTIHGSQIALSDNLLTNLNLIRSYYRQPTLNIEYMSLGEVNQQKVAIVYDTEKVNTQALKLIKEKLQRVDKQVISAANQFNNYLNDKRFSLFPQMIMTERPDRIIYNIAGEKS